MTVTSEGWFFREKAEFWQKRADVYERALREIMRLEKDFGDSQLYKIARKALEKGAAK